MKRNLLLAFTLSSALLVSACGEENNNGEANETTASSKVLTEADFDKMYTNPKDYKGYELTYTGKVFVTPERDENGTYLQVYADPENHTQNTLVAYENPNFDINEGDYVTITGKVKDEYEGENALGGTVTAPVIEASSVEIVDYITAVAPTLQTLEVNQTLNQHGVTVKVEKVEFAENHTRVYVTATNDSAHQVSLYTYSTKLLVGNQQYENESIYEANYPELQSDILAGIESTGILTFPTIDPATTTLQIVIEGSSDNWELDFEPFVFKVD